MKRRETCAQPISFAAEPRTALAVIPAKQDFRTFGCCFGSPVLVHGRASPPLIDQKALLVGQSRGQCRRLDPAGEDLFGERVLQVFLDRALQRARAVDRIVAGAGEPLLGLLVELDDDLAIGEELVQALDLDIDDLVHVLAAQAAEEDDLVQAVQDSGRKWRRTTSITPSRTTEVSWPSG